MKQQQSEARVNALDYWQVIRKRYGAVLLSCVLAALTALVVTTIMPRRYAGKVLLEIERSSATEADSAAGSSAALSRSEREIITAKETLDHVIDKLGLLKKWDLGSDKNAAYSRLKSMVEADEDRKTNLVRIVVYSTDKVEAKELANAIAEAYLKRRYCLEQQRIDRSLAALDSTRNAQELTVKRAYATLQELIERHQLHDLRPLHPYRGHVEYQQAKDEFALQFEILQKVMQQQERARTIKLTPKQPATIHEHPRKPSN